MKSYVLLVFILLPLLINAQDAIIGVNASQGQKAVSPYIYGKNNNFSDQESNPTTGADIAMYKDAGLRFARENSGNNATKYNWRLKLSSHPDWYNNVYEHNWNYVVETALAEMPGLQIMFAFQLLGKAASNKDNNFNDWGYNQSQWWNGVGQNLAGGGQVNASGGSDALVEGNSDLYLQNWTADSTTKILEYWFGQDGKDYNKNNLLYWSMDNEPEIWAHSHDDVMSTQISADAFMDKYFEVAKKARAQFPEIKIAGPVTANEWQWYKWAEETLTIDGENYCWLEYFIKRVADEQKATGIRLLDVLDIHWYPGETSAADVVQLHRVFYDENFDYPGANGVKTINGGWDNTQTKEYIFKRINDWLDLHFGNDHGITIGLTEFGTNTEEPNVNSVLYASILGTFANHGVEVFTPWHWKTGMWETLHLFSRYAKSTCVATGSTNESLVSGYSTINENVDSMTIILVNRDLTSSKSVKVNLTDFSTPDGNSNILTLSSLPANETFVSHTNNALQRGTVNVSNNSFTITLPALSTTAVLLKAGASSIGDSERFEETDIKITPNPTKGSFELSYKFRKPTTSDIIIYNSLGKVAGKYKWEANGFSSFRIENTGFEEGVYYVEVRNSEFVKTTKLFVKK